MQHPLAYYSELAKLYQEKRDTIVRTLDEAGIQYFVPKGAYYLFADISGFGYKTDIECTNYLIKEIGVAVVPGSSFFFRPEDGQQFIRFCFSKTTETLERARKRLLKLQPTLHKAT